MHLKDIKNLICGLTNSVAIKQLEKIIKFTLDIFKK